MKISFKDLSPWLKAAVVTSWITLAFYGIYFLIGFIAQLTY